MTQIVLDQTQADLLTHSQGEVVLQDQHGNVLGYAVRDDFMAEDIADCERRATSSGPWYTTEQVIAHLSSLETT